MEEEPKPKNQNELITPEQVGNLEKPESKPQTEPSPTTESVPTADEFKSTEQRADSDFYNAEVKEPVAMAGIDQSVVDGILAEKGIKPEEKSQPEQAKRETAVFDESWAGQETRKAEIEGTLNGLREKNSFLDNNQLLQEWMVLRYNKDEKKESNARHFGHIAQKESAGGQKFLLTFFSNLWEGKRTKDGQPIEGSEGTFNKEYVLSHELGHGLIDTEDLIYSRANLIGLRDALEDPEKQADLPEELQEIITTMQNPQESAGKETQYVKEKLDILANPTKLQAEKEKREKITGETISLEDFTRQFKYATAQEMLAERMTAYLMSPEKSALGMLKQRITHSPEDSLKSYLGITDESKLAELKAAVASAKDEEAKKLLEGNPKFATLLKENEKFFNAFHSKLKDKKPEDIMDLLDEQGFDFDDFYGGGSVYETSGLSSGGSSPSFVEAIIGFIEMLLGQK